MKYVKMILGGSLLSMFMGCNVETSPVENKLGATIERYSVRKDNNEKQGVYQVFDSTGSGLMQEVMYENGKPVGVEKYFYPNKQVSREQQYEGGELNGAVKEYYASGKLKLEGQHVKNKMDGVWKYYYENGQLREEVMFKDNEENGAFKEFYKNGKPKTEGTYLNGDSENGLLILYDSTGAVERKMNCVAGVCKTIE